MIFRIMISESLMIVLFLVLIGGISTVQCEPKQDWGYVDVRPGAHMFWWLYFSTAKVSASPPLVIYLEGGPGGSSVGFGNFGMIGPLDVNLNPRNTTWLQKASLLFIDNPVGAGYSYVDNDDAYTTNLSQITDDLMVLMKAFFKKQPSFQTVPLWIFTESYGGKMTAALSQKLVQVIQDGGIKSNFKGCTLGDPWISPVDSVKSCGSYLYHTSLVDKVGLAEINDGAAEIEELIDGGKFVEATTAWENLEVVISRVTGGVNIYNILKSDNQGSTLPEEHFGGGYSDLDQLYQRHVGIYYANNALDDLMNGPIKKKLGIPTNVTWGGQAKTVFQKQSGDLMRSVQDIVDDLISNTSLQVNVYSGQLDLVVDTVGTEAWVNNLRWPGLAEWNATVWDFLAVGDQRAGFYKSFKNFTFFWILKAGHMVPADAAETALKMMEMIIAQA